MSKDGEKDKDLWDRATRDITRLNAAEKTVPLPRRRRIKVSNPVPDVTMPKGFELPSGGGIDRKTEDRLRKGMMEIDARLDLHGYTLTQAKERLLQFIAMNFASGNRSLLIVTGKGRTESFKNEGAIKREFRFWLEDPKVRACILSISTAQPRHGGSGAYYVYLRKKR